jgi:hypothetical protein
VGRLRRFALMHVVRYSNIANRCRLLMKFCWPSIGRVLLEWTGQKGRESFVDGFCVGFAGLEKGNAFL